LLIAVGFVQALPQHTAQASPTHPSAKASPTLSTQPPPDATKVDVLLLHGLEGQSTANCYHSPTFTPPNDYSRWDGFVQVNNASFAGYHWDPPLIHALSYYTDDVGCDDDIGRVDPTAPCDGYYGNNSDSNEGTNNEDIRHLACRFYWYVYDNYTLQGKYVHILAHSMGGIITKWALSMAGHDSTYFPYPLLVYNVVTLSTPFQGVPSDFDLAARFGCSLCFEGLQLENGSSQSIIQDLYNFPSTEGAWTVISSFGQNPNGGTYCDTVEFSNPYTTVTPGPSLSAAQVVYYDQCIFHEEDYPGSEFPGSTSYQDDASTSLNYTGYLGTPSTFKNVSASTGLPHPLAEAIKALGVTRGPNTYPYLSQMPYTYAANNADGRLEVFARGSDHNIWHIWQTCPNCGWSSWSPLQSGQSFNGDPAVGQDLDGRLEVFARGTNNAILVDAQEHSGEIVGGWTGWQTLSQANAFQGTPMVARNMDGRLEIFARGSDGNIWHNWESCVGCGWNGWVALQSGHSFKGDPVVGINSDGTLEAFALGNDGNIWHNKQNCAACSTSWSGWTALQSGKSFLGRLSVGRNADSRLEVYALDWNNNVVHNYELSGGGWSGWGALQSQTAHIFNSTPAVGNNADGRLEVFTTENAHAEMWHDWQTSPNGNWNGWANLQSGFGFVGAAPATAQIYDGRLEVIAVGRDNNIYHNFVQTGGWSGWQVFQSGYSFAPSDCHNTPSDELCDNGFYTNETCPDTNQLETASNPYVSVTIHWSSTCQTNWTSAKSLTSFYILYKVDIERQSNTSDGALTYTDYPSTTSWYTNMIWSLNNPARSCAWYYDPNTMRVFGPVCTAWH
jgi:acylphosphatase